MAKRKANRKAAKKKPKTKASTALKATDFAPANRPMTEKMHQFVEEYFIDFNATQAAIRAGYTDNAYSASTIGSRLMADPRVREEIATIKEELFSQASVDRHRIVMELLQIAVGNLQDVLDDEDLKKLPRSAAATIKKWKSIKTVEEETDEESTKTTKKSIEVEQYDKLKALEILAKLEKLFPEEGKGDVKVNLHLGNILLQEDDRRNAVIDTKVIEK